MFPLSPYFPWIEQIKLKISEITMFQATKSRSRTFRGDRLGAGRFGAVPFRRRALGNALFTSLKLRISVYFVL